MVVNDKSRIGLRVYAPGGPPFIGRLSDEAMYDGKLIHRSNAERRVEH
jgi:hypothetical protein